MVGVITEEFNQGKVQDWSDKGYKVNVLLKRNSPDKTFHKINWGLVLNKYTKIIVFNLSKCYQSSYKLMFGALKNNKQIIVLYQGKRYDIIDLRELDTKGITELFQQSKEEFFEKKNHQEKLIKFRNILEYTHEQPIEDIRNELTKCIKVKELEEGYGRIEFNLIDMYELNEQINWNDEYSVRVVYMQIEYYLEHNIPFSKVIEDDIEIESFGDITYLEDTVYKQKRIA